MTDFQHALSVLSAGLLILAFGSPLRLFWGACPWWTPFVIWLLAIAVLAIADRHGGDGRPGL